MCIVFVPDSLRAAVPPSARPSRRVPARDARTALRTSRGKSVSEDAKAVINKKVMNGRFWSSEFDKEFGNPATIMPSERATPGGASGIRPARRSF